MIKPLVRFLLKKSVSNTKRTPSMVQADLINKVAVVGLYEPGSFEFAEQYVQELRHRGIKTVDFYVAFKSKKAQAAYALSRKAFLFNPRSFNWMGKLIDQELHKGISRKYDMLIDLSMGRSLIADLVISMTDAKWKAGKKGASREYLLDFMINTADRDLRNLVHHLDHYLMNFNKSIQHEGF